MKQQSEERRKRFPDRLKAGYIVKTGKDQYKIYPALSDQRGNMCYRVSEAALRKMRLSPSIDVKYMYKPGVWNTQKPGQPLHVDRHDLDPDYQPYMCEVMYNLKEDGRINRIEPLNGTPKPGMQTGWLLSSSWIKGKTSHYLIREPDQGHPGIEVPTALVDSYNRDLERKKYKGNKNWNHKFKYYHLPEQIGKPKPVFYAQSEDQLYFGFTPYLRIFYDRDVYQGIPEAFRHGWKFDYGKSLFGFASAKNHGINQSYKGRLSFGDLQAEGQPRALPEIRVVLGEPKATAYPLYLKQPEAEQGKLHTYNSQRFELRGMKLYWLKTREHPESSGKEKVESIIRPLDRGTVFRGTIRFFNLAPDELGLLLWALMLEPNCAFNVGMAKPYGFGQMKLIEGSVRLFIENLERKYKSRGNMTFRKDYLEPDDPQKYIAEFKKYMKQQYQIEIDEEPHVQSFFTMRRHRMEPEQSRYMSLDNKEYASLDPLPDVFEIIRGKRRRFQKQTGLGMAASEQSYRANLGMAASEQSYRAKGHQNRRPQPESNFADRRSPKEKAWGDERWSVLKRLKKDFRDH